MTPFKHPTRLFLELRLTADHQSKIQLWVVASALLTSALQFLCQLDLAETLIEEVGASCGAGTV